MIALASTTALADAGRPLTGDRWSDRKYGLSFIPPIDTQLVQQPGDNRLVRIVDNDAAFEIGLSMKRAARPATLAQIIEAIRLKIVDENTTSLVLEEKPGKYGDMPGFIGFYRVPMTGIDDVLVGLAVAQVDEFNFAVFELRGKHKQYEMLRPTLGAVFKTLTVADQREMVKRRREAIERSVAWRKGVGPAQFIAAIAGERFYRIIENRQDIGWMRVAQSHGEYNATMGIKVTVQTHLRLASGRLDAVADYFRPDDPSQLGEAWSVRSTLRQMPGKKPDEALTAVETGTAKLGRISVVIDRSAGESSKRYSFQRPSIGYLPQAEAWLLPRTLPRDTPAEYGFYWYNTNQQQVTFRTDRVTPTLDGYVIHTRLSPNEPELISRFDALGEMLEKDLGGGKRLVRTNAAALKALWRLR